MTPHPPYSLRERIERALDAAGRAERTPTAIVIGSDDLPALRELEPELVGELAHGARFRDVRVRVLEGVFMSRIQLASVQGQPNAVPV